MGAVMKKIHIFLLLTAEIFFGGFLLPQPTLEWERVYPENYSFYSGSEDMVIDDSGNVYITGYSDTLGVNYNGYCTIKYSSAGNQKWIAKYYGIRAGGRFSYSIAIDSSHNTYITGYSYNGNTYFDYCTVKYDAGGIFQWVQCYDGPSHGLDKAQKIAADKVGNVYVTGIQFWTNRIPNCHNKVFNRWKRNMDSQVWCP
jgi:hypothetical protein